MFRKLGYIIVAFLLSCSLLLGGSAKEFIHLWAHHEDTVHDIHHNCPKGEAHIESEHHHCDFLGFVLAPFDGISFSPRPVFFDKTEVIILYRDYQAVFQPTFVAYQPSRGPPVCIPS